MAKKKTAAIELQENETGNIRGRYTDVTGREYEFTLNNRQTGYYAMTGTLKMIDPVSKHVLETYDSNRGKCVPASIQIHVRKPAAEDEPRRLIEKEVERAVRVLNEQYMKQFAQVLKNGKLLDEMTLLEARAAYEQEAAIHFSKKTKAQNTYMRILQKLHFSGQAMGALNKKALLVEVAQVATGLTGQKDTLAKLLDFVAYIEEKQHMKSEVISVVEETLGIVKLRIEEEKARSEGRRAAKNASNSDVLSNEAEGELNSRCIEFVKDPRYIVLALLKGSGLAVDEVCKLKVEQCEREAGNPEKVFLKIRRDFASATQDYTFPIFPHEAWLLNQYLDMLVEEMGAERVEPEKFLFSQDGGITPLDGAEIHKVCRIELQRLRFGVADLLGNVDLKKEKGVQLLKKTYEHRLEKYCGVTREKDEGAWLFFRHLSLGRRVQADHYRGFSGESGRQCLYDYVRQDRRFLPELRSGKKGATSYRTMGNRREYTVYPCDRENEQQLLLEFELKAGEHIHISAEHGCFFAKEERNGILYVLTVRNKEKQILSATDNFPLCVNYKVE